MWFGHDDCNDIWQFLDRDDDDHDDDGRDRCLIDDDNDDVLN